MTTDPNLQNPQNNSNPSVNPQPQGQDPQPNAQPQGNSIPNKTEPFKTFASEEEYDNAAAKIRGNAERKAKVDLLKKLGLNENDEDKLEKFKLAYENSLTEEQKKEEALQELNNLKNEIVEKDAIIVALTKLSGKESSEVTKLVKMAKGLVGEDYNIEQALDEVMKMANFNENTTSNPPAPPKPPIASKPFNNPSTLPTGNEENNPFKTDNLTEQGLLIRHDPVKARELAKAAGVPITF